MRTIWRGTRASIRFHYRKAVVHRSRTPRLLRNPGPPHLTGVWSARAPQGTPPRVTKWVVVPLSASWYGTTLTHATPSRRFGLFESAVSTIAEGIILLNLARIRGTEAVCSRVPSQAGVYAWFQNYEPPDPETANAETFAEYLHTQATRPHCIPRIGRIAPLYEVELRSRKEIGRRKLESMLQLCASSTFRRAVTTVLGSAIFFQQPLYVGKGSNLPARIRHHLAPASELRRRLGKVGIDIDRTWLVCMPIEGFDCEDDVFEGGEIGQAPFDVETESTLPTELVLEDLFSKLFHPLFTSRYG
jgi:hypothetical protein